MLQWMGGSRRKVTTSRKSTHNRQRQYFEQRKRQQQASKSENHADGRNKGFDYLEGPRSLDVLSLSNVAAATKNFCVDKDEDGLSKEKIKASESFLEFPPNQDIADPSNHQKELKKALCMDNGSLNLNVSAATTQNCAGIPPDRNHCNIAQNKPDEWKIPSFSDPRNSSKIHDKADELKRMSEFSVLDLLNDDRSCSKSEELPSGETHVAFSVKGLGKVMMETPVHSPKQAVSSHSPSKMASGWMCSSENLPDDLRLKPGGMDDIFFSAGDSSVEYLNLDTLVLSGKGSMPLYADAYQTEYDIFTRKEVSYNVESTRKATREDGPNTYFGRSVSMNDYDFVNFDSERYHGVDRSSHFKSKQHAWSFCMTEDAIDNISLCSEESCSSTAVRNEQTGNLETDFLKLRQHNRKSEVNSENEQTDNLGTDFLKLRQNNRKSVKVSSEKKSGMKTFVNEVVHADINEVQQEKSPVGTANYWTIPTKWTLQTKNCLNISPAFEKKLQAECVSFSREDHTSVNKGLAPSFLYKLSTGTDTATVDCRVGPEDRTFNLSKVPRVHIDRDLPQRISTPGNHIKDKPRGRIQTEKNILRQSLDHIASLTTLHLLKREDLPQDQSYCAESEKGNQYPSVTRFQKSCKDNEASDFQLTDCRKILKKPQMEISVEKSTLSSGNARASVVAELRDRCSEHEKLKRKTPEPSEPSEVRNVSILSKVSLAMENIPTSVQCFSSQRMNGPGSSSHKSYNKESRKENHKPANDNVESKVDSKADKSYQLMLESYVLQLLCVQKVLLESSNQDKR